MSNLDAQGRCCGRKPIVYKRPRHYFFCDRCDRAFSPDGKQFENWAWARVGITADEWRRKDSTPDAMTPANAAAYHGCEDDGL